MRRTVKNRRFLALLHSRGETTGTIAEKIKSCRCHVSKVLSGFSPGIPTRRKILNAAILTEAEVQALGWDVPCGTKFYVEQFEGRAE